MGLRIREKKFSIDAVLCEIQVPVILTGSDLVSTALNWDLDYLQQHLGLGPFTVFVNSRLDESSAESLPHAPNCSDESQKKKAKNTQESPESQFKLESSSGSSSSRSKRLTGTRTKKRHNYFKYYDEKKVESYNGDFTPEIKRSEISFDEFLVQFNGNR